MAQGRDQQGTGRHPHKSTEEPYPHTKEEGTQHGRSQGSSGSHGRSHDGGDNNRSQGGGSHGQSHGGGREEDRGHGRSQETQSQGRGSQGDQQREEEADLKRREYRGEDGQIHHHTRTYMEQHAHDRGDDENRGGENRSQGGGSQGGGSHGGSHGREREHSGGDNRSQGQSHSRDNNNSDRRR